MGGGGLEPCETAPGAVASLPRRASAPADVDAPTRGRAGGVHPVGPLLLVAGAVVFGLVELRSELHLIAYTNDSSMHEEMVRFATAQLRAGHLPMRSWFPFLGLGSPDFLHYQSLGATLTGVAGLLVGPDHAFVWSLYLVLATWPVTVYACGRCFGLGRGAAAAAAACSPFLVDRFGIGYGELSYVAIGFGLWSQLLAMWTLPLAWGTSWQAVHRGRYRRLAPVLVALTVALHFMTGYLALGVIALWPFLARPQLLARLRRAGETLLLSGFLAAWVIVPLVVMKPDAATNEFLANGPDVNSYGALPALRWLADGQLLDAHRLPVLTVLAGAGLAATIWTWTRAATVGRRAVVAALVGSLLLFFGKPTLGPFLVLVPGHADLFLRRFLMGIQLAALLLAGTGAAALGGAAWRLLRRIAATPSSRLAGPLAGALLGAVALVAVLSPAWQQLAAVDTGAGTSVWPSSNAAWVADQARADATAGRQVDALVRLARATGPGRIYAGMPSNWGLDFAVGGVPVFRYLASLSADEVGFTNRTASLMTDPEAYFDQSVPGDETLFGVRYLLLPSTMAPPVPARRLATRGIYALWSVGPTTLTGVVDTVGPPIVATRHDLGRATAAFLASPLPTEDRYPTLAFNGAPAARPTLPAGAHPVGPPGRVLHEDVRLGLGEATTTVQLRRTAVVVLKASYDPGWQATVDGRPAPTQIVAPALVGVRVGAGRHTVVFRYVAFGGYPLLFELAGATLVGLVVVPAARRRWRRRPPGAGAPVAPSNGDLLP